MNQLGRQGDDFLFLYWSSFHYKDRLSKYDDSNYKDKTAVRPSYLYDGNHFIKPNRAYHWQTIMTNPDNKNPPIT